MERRGRQVGALGAEHGEIGDGVGGDHPGRYAGAVGESDLHVLLVTHDVLVGEDQSTLPEHDPGAETLPDPNGDDRGL